MTRRELFDIDRARRETPGCAYSIHFNNAGAALIPQPVLDSVINHLRLEAEIGGYEAEEHAQETLEHVYAAVATLLGCASTEIAVIENATRAWDMAFYAIPFNPGDRILTSMAEYASNYIAFLQVARRINVSIEPIPNDEQGQVSVAALQTMIDSRVKVIAITHVPTNGGLVNPAAEIGAIARKVGCFYLLDACQSVGQMPVRVDEIGCDMLSATGRKFLRGPRGTGFLYVRRDRITALEPPLLDLHAATWVDRNRYTIRDDARRFENWEANCAAKIGLGVAIDYALKWGLEAIQERIYTLASKLRIQLSDIPGITVHDRGVVQCGIVTFTVEGWEPRALSEHLRKQRIHVWFSTRNSTRLDMEQRGLDSLVRASLHYYNTEVEIDQLCEQLAAL